MKSLLFILLFTSGFGYAQNVSIKELELKYNPSGKYYAISYPVIISKNKKVERLINQQLIEKVFYVEDTTSSIKKIIIDNINESGLTDLSYETTYNDKGILSLIIFRQGCTAYCSSWQTCFNVDLQTGAEIFMEDLIITDSLSSFQKMVHLKKLNALNAYKNNELKIDTTQNIDSSTYKWALQQLEYCYDSTRIDNFWLTPGGIEVLDPCEFPHAIRWLSPEYHLFFTFEMLSAYLKPRFKKILHP